MELQPEISQLLTTWLKASSRRQVENFIDHLPTAVPGFLAMALFPLRMSGGFSDRFKQAPKPKVSKLMPYQGTPNFRKRVEDLVCTILPGLSPFRSLISRALVNKLAYGQLPVSDLFNALFASAPSPEGVVDRLFSEPRPAAKSVSLETPVDVIRAALEARKNNISDALSKFVAQRQVGKAIKLVFALIGASFLAFALPKVASLFLGASAQEKTTDIMDRLITAVLRGAAKGRAP
jgi:hypothetical protein